MKQGTLSSFISFIKKPDYNKIENLTFIEKIKELLKIYLTSILLVTAAALINKLLIYFDVYSEYTKRINRLPEIFSNDFIKSYLIFGLFIPPIIEEFTFRLLLIKFNKNFINISLSLITGSILYLFFYKYLWYPQTPITTNIISYLYPILFAIPTYGLLLFSVKSNFNDKWNTNFASIYYIFIIIFAVLHITTLNITTEHYYFIPIIILPFLILSMSLGYTRIKLGILYSIILHFIFNAPMIVKLLITTS